jgi:hypothetical protein
MDAEKKEDPAERVCHLLIAGKFLCATKDMPKKCVSSE